MTTTIPPLREWLPTQPGRCKCGHHVATQGHRDGCEAKK